MNQYVVRINYMLIKQYDLNTLKTLRPKIVSRILELTNSPRFGSRMQSHIRYSNEGGTIFLAWKRGQVIGWSFIPHVNKKKPKRFYTQQIWCFVDPKFRKQGVATKLVTKAIDFAKKEDPSREIRVYPFTRHGNKLYKKFEEVVICPC